MVNLNTIVNSSLGKGSREHFSNTRAAGFKTQSFEAQSGFNGVFCNHAIKTRFTVLAYCVKYLNVVILFYFQSLGLHTEETILSSLTNLSYQSSSAATSSLEQFFSSLLSSISTRGSELFVELQTLKVVIDAMCRFITCTFCVHVHCYVLFFFIELLIVFKFL